MKRIHALGLLAALAASIAAFDCAAAKDMRFPDTGDVAFAMSLPDGVTANPDNSGNLIVTAADHAWALSLSVINDKDAVAAQFDELAKLILDSAGAQPFSRHEPGSIGVKPAQAYFSTMQNDKKLNLDLKLIIVKIEPSTVATETLITLPDITAAQKKSLDATVKGITLIGG